MSDGTFHGLTAPEIRELRLRGYTTSEIAAMRSSSAESLSSFMSAHGVSLTMELHDTPPKPERLEEKTIIYPTTISPTSGVRHVRRVSLPRISMHVRSLEGSP